MADGVSAGPIDRNRGVGGGILRGGLTVRPYLGAESDHSPHPRGIKQHQSTTVWREPIFGLQITDAMER